MGRGLTAAALLAVPVAVAATIGFQGSLSGLTGGLDSLASEPERSQAADGGPDEIDTAIAAIAVPAPGPTGPDGGRGGGNGGGEGPGGGETPPEAPPGGGGGGVGGGAGGVDINPPDVTIPDSAPGGAADLVPGLGDSVDGLLP